MRIVRQVLLAAIGVLGLHAVHAADSVPTCPSAPQPVAQAEATAGMRTARDRGFLWRLEKDGRTSWLYGTIHVAKRNWMYPGPATRRALHDADSVALELDVLDPAIAAELSTAITARADAPPLPAGLARRVQAQAAAACLGEGLGRMRPEMQVMTLAVLSGRARGLDPAYGIDVFLAGYARGLKKAVVSLETPAQQMSLLLSDDPAEVAQTVEDVLQSLESKNAGPQLDRLAGAWDEGRLADLENYADWCECLDTPERRKSYDALVIGRNPSLARHVADIHQSGHSVFAAVGALHMVGPQGLPMLLAALGFNVERVFFASPRMGGQSASDARP
ncbi:hypothetical protein RD110_02025 [Rhodoferax koreense]|uniref:TraB/GumN family protein n=1 Tax=Rhodoferax koreensis TaxID=1842727 RepID=A0A1P8JQY1_9BURK|nr:TraB/GumN family protein [Rhodoferax koreense]APW36135.1 hypothetical protein RD110_02025 [Rhodoferax koreense]